MVATRSYAGTPFGECREETPHKRYLMRGLRDAEKREECLNCDSRDFMIT